MNRFEKMSTRELEMLLKEDAARPENEQLDEETVLEILQILEQRQNYNVPETETALKSFKENYMPERENITAIDILRREKRKAFIRRAVKSMLKTACIALVTVALLFAGTMTAEAAGYNVYGKMAEAAGYNVIERKAHWDDSLFYFDGVGVYSPGVYAAGDFDAHPDLEELQLDMIHNMFTEDVLITYVPEGYEVEEYTLAKFDYFFNRTQYNINLISENNKITVECHNILGTNGTYPKDAGEPETLEFRDIIHYIMQYDGKWQALWKNGTVECRIYGVESREELIKMVESVYARPNLD